MDDDVLSLQIEDSFKSLFILKDYKVLHRLDSALKHFQNCCGNFSQIYCKGSSASLLGNKLNQYKIEHNIQENFVGPLYIIDR